MIEPESLVIFNNNRKIIINLTVGLSAEWTSIIYFQHPYLNHLMNNYVLLGRM